RPAPGGGADRRAVGQGGDGGLATSVNGGIVMAMGINQKCQVTIPKQIRDRLNIKPGSTVDFALTEDGRITLVKAGGQTGHAISRFAQIRGSATARLSAKEIMVFSRR